VKPSQPPVPTDLDELERLAAAAVVGETIGGDPDRRREERHAREHARETVARAVPSLLAELRVLRLANARMASDLDTISGALADMGDISTDEAQGVGEVCAELRELRAAVAGAKDALADCIRRLKGRP